MGSMVVPEGPADAVVVGWTRSSFTFEAVSRAAAAVRAGARLVATNEDPTLPTPDGPGARSRRPPGCDRHRRRAPGPRWPGSPTARPPTPSAPASPPGELRAMVGDRPSTDGALAGQLGIPFALVLSGVTDAGHVPADARPAAVAPDLVTLMRTTLGGR